MGVLYIDSYFSSIVSEFFRIILIENDASFSFETVMSHPSKMSFLTDANKKGFKTYLYFISTQDVSININRVKIRVEKGGHNVDAEKVEKRYYKSMELLKDAFLSADRAFILDNSTEDKLGVLVEKDGDTVHIHSKVVPQWVKIYLLDKLPSFKN